MDVDVCNCNNILNLCPDDDDIIHKLKNKAVCGFINLLSSSEKGIYQDYEFLLQQFNLLDSCNNIDNSLFILQFYLNNNGM